MTALPHLPLYGGSSSAQLGYVDTEKAFTELCHSWKMHQIHASGGLQLEHRSLAVLTKDRSSNCNGPLVCHIWYIGDVGWSGQQMRIPLFSTQCDAQQYKR